MTDQTEILAEQVRGAVAAKQPLQIVGGESKRFYGRAATGERLQVSGHSGVVSYEPTELVITARSGTALKEIKAALAEQGQMLPFEPPSFADTATLGGTVACNLSGPRRPYLGAVRDFVLGCRLINGNADVLHFGGEVMKNVAGYDVSRLQCGAMGTLGVLLEVSLKVLPLPEAEITLVQECDAQEAIDTMNRLGGQPVPLSAACHDGNKMYLRLSGSGDGISAAQKRIGGDLHDHGEEFWRQLNEQRLPFFDGDTPLWRLSLAPATPMLNTKGRTLIDWGGAQRWIRTDEPMERLRAAAARAGGHATLFRSGAGSTNSEQPFHPLDDGLMQLHTRLKHSFDAHGIFNPGRMYEAI